LKNKSLFIISIILCLAAGITISVTVNNVAAQDEQLTDTPFPNYSHVVVEEAVIRSGPGQEYISLGEGLHLGNYLRPLNRNQQGDWVMISYGYYSFGWIRHDLGFWTENIDALPIINEDNLTPTYPPDYATITPHYYPTETPSENYIPLHQNYILIHSGPGRNYQDIGVLAPGSIVEPVGRNEETSWILIRFTFPTEEEDEQPQEGFAWISIDPVFWVNDLETLPILGEDNLTPTATYTMTSTPTATFTATMTSTASNTPTMTSTPSPTDTNTATNTPTDIPVPSDTATNTPVPTDTPVPSDTTTNTPVPTDLPTNTPVPTDMPTNTLVPTDVPTNTPVPSDTATNTPVPTDVSTNTTVPSDTAANTPVPTDVPTETPVPSDTATNTPVPTDVPTDTSVPSNTATNTPVPTDVPTDTSVPSDTVTNTPVPTDVPTETPVPSNTATNTPVPTDTAIPSDTAEAVVAIAATDTPIPPATVTDAPSATPLPAATETSTAIPAVETGTTDGQAEDKSSIPPEAIVGGIAIFLVLAYIVFYLRGLAAAERYSKGFVIDHCPVCGEGNLSVDTRHNRLFGIPRARRTIRCDFCRSVLRETGYRRWRYAVDPLDNSAMYEHFNEQEIDEKTIKSLFDQPVRPDNAAQGPVRPPSFVDDDETEG
jgi:hypothetical protein